MRFLPWLLVIGLCGFGYYEQQNARKASELNKGLEEELAITKAKLDSATIENVTGKHQLERNLKEIADKDATRREMADLQGKLKSSEEQAQMATAALEECKKQVDEFANKVSEFELIKQKLADSEGKIAAANTERDAAKTQVTTLQAEVQRLQQATARPPFGSTIGTRR
jgi:chromosome segregation ATPase